MIARELVSRAAERLDSGSLHWAVAIATFATLLDLAALGFAFTYFGQRQPRKIALGAAIVLVPALLIGLFAAHGAAPGAGLPRVLAERVLAQLSRAPAAALPPALRFAVTTALLLGAALCVAKPSALRKTSVVLALCLLSLGAPDMPLPALWLVVAALLAPEQTEPTIASSPPRASESNPPRMTEDEGALPPAAP